MSIRLLSPNVISPFKMSSPTKSLGIAVITFKQTDISRKGELADI